VDRIQLRIIFSGRSYEYGNETSGSLKGGEFLECVNECQMLRKKKPLSMAVAIWLVG
jgi:hypothetical protein